MTIKILIDALRFGQAIGAKSQWRWAGAVGLVAGFGFYVAKANGLLGGVELGDWMSLVEVAINLGLTVGAYSVVATSEKVGILPPQKGSPGDALVHDDVERLRDSELSSDTDEANQHSKSSGLPDGPFWDNSR